MPDFLLFFFTYMDNGDLIIRSDLDSRGFFLGDEDPDLALTPDSSSGRRTIPICDMQFSRISAYQRHQDSVETDMNEYTVFRKRKKDVSR